MTSLITTPVGSFRGKLVKTSEDIEVLQFLGIPYSQRQPVEDQRFAQMELVSQIEDVYDSCEFKNAAIQRPHSANTAIISEQTAQGEDCLWLNIWVPCAQSPISEESRSMKKAVFVFIHGGAFQQGTSSEDVFNGKELCANQQIVVVTFNYRLGILGNLFLPEVVAPNLGMRDQQLAIEWVLTNISYFGGDRENLTIGGHSVGSTSVCYHMLNPTTRNHFHQAILMSGSLFGYFGFEKNKEKALRESHEFLKANQIDLSEDSNEVLQKLRNLPVEQFRKQYIDSESGNLLSFKPVMDFDYEEVFKSDEVFTKDILVTLTNGEGDAFMYSMFKDRSNQLQNSTNIEVYESTLSMPLQALLKENTLETIKNIPNFYRNCEIPFILHEPSLFDRASMALGDLLNDYPLMKFVQFILKNQPQVNIYMKIFDYRFDINKCWILKDAIPEYFKCGHGFDMNLLFKSPHKDHSLCDKDERVVQCVMDVVGNMCKLNVIDHESKEKLIGNRIKLSNDEMAIPIVDRSQLGFAEVAGVRTYDTAKCNKSVKTLDNESCSKITEGYKDHLIPLWGDVYPIQY